MTQSRWSLPASWQARSAPRWDCRLEWRRDQRIKNAKVWGENGLDPDLVARTLDMFPNLPDIFIYSLSVTLSSGVYVWSDETICVQLSTQEVLRKHRRGTIGLLQAPLVNLCLFSVTLPLTHPPIPLPDKSS